jgi:hypothetical protein
LNTLAEIYIIVTLRITRRPVFSVCSRRTIWQFGKEKHSCSHRTFDGPSKQASIRSFVILERKSTRARALDRTKETRKQKSKKASPTPSFIPVVKCTAPCRQRLVKSSLRTVCLIDRSIDSSSRAISSDSLGSWLRCAEGLEGHR